VRLVGYLFCVFFSIRYLRRRRRLAGAERGFSKMVLNFHRERMRATEHAPRGPFNFLERPNGLADIVERGGWVLVERLRVTPPNPEREIITLSENASRHGNIFMQQCLGFFEAL